ncbi:serine protease inhibitor ecotin [Shewanella sp. SG41-4]|uniref:serine protease inhibitor ecotin n=1 Tax=Shewanella sp. SG41-4 TaxID=2760976 RepID=UPI001600DF9C|nr:serine protease inhibitor ecotin [Shewanella sp. SG41-4]MBB1439915.1 serine protease inhibitor ecotin [Shewanella sp. SG41-4]
MKRLSLTDNIKIVMTFTIILAGVSSFGSRATSPVDNNYLNTLKINSTVMDVYQYQPQEASKMYPAPTAGMVQHILTLPALADEHDYMLEVQIGQNKIIDCNKPKLIGEIDKLSLAGWGYVYYQVNKVMQGPTTKMMCTNAKSAQFIVLNEALTLGYDSRQPKVFYLPEGTDLRYRIWKKATEFVFSGQ